MKITLRSIKTKDAFLLLNNAGEEWVKLNICNEDVTNIEGYEKYICEHLVNQRIFILEVDGEPVGVSRLISYMKGIDAISYFILPPKRGKKHGFLLVRETLLQTTKSVIAEVKNNNLSAIKILEQAGIPFLYKKNDISVYFKNSFGLGIESFIEMLKISQEKLQAEKIAEFSRRVSFGDLVTERNKNASTYNFGKGTTCYDNVLILGEVSVGNNVWIGPNVILDGTGGLKIGDNVSISAGTQIYTHETVEWNITMGKAPFKYSPVTIGSGVYIGPNTIIQCGVNIGDKVIIGAMSFVNRSIASNKKAWGCPAVIKDNI